MQYEEINGVIRNAWLSIRDTPYIASSFLHKLNNTRKYLRRCVGDKL
jgi:hypothetical protein